MAKVRSGTMRKLLAAEGLIRQEKRKGVPVHRAAGKIIDEARNIAADRQLRNDRKNRRDNWNEFGNRILARFEFAIVSGLKLDH
jgi:hypothetical protein